MISQSRKNAKGTMTEYNLLGDSEAKENRRELRMGEVEVPREVDFDF